MRLANHTEYDLRNSYPRYFLPPVFTPAFHAQVKYPGNPKSPRILTPG